MQQSNLTSSMSLHVVIVALMTVSALCFTTKSYSMNAADVLLSSPIMTFHMSSSVDSDTDASTTLPDFNSVEVAKTGGQGVATASQQALSQGLSLGAPRGRPTGGHYITTGGIHVTAKVEGLEYSRTGDEASLSNEKSSEFVIESLVEKLDSHKGVLLTSSYEFPGRYARWSLGFIDPPLELSGKANQCTIRALNDRGKILLPAIEKAMQVMKDGGTLSEVNVIVEDGEESNILEIDVTIVPPPPVGTFSEEERSRQVRRVSSVFHTCCL